MDQKKTHFTGSFDSLFDYWQNEDRAKKFKNGGTRTKVIRYLLNLAEVEIHKGVWIDTAVGAGYVQSQLYKTVLPNLLVGIDFSRSMLELVDKPVERILGSAFNLPVRSRAANISTNIFCLSDYPDPSQAFDELGRITKNRGVAFYLDYSNEDQYWKLRQQAHDPDKVMGNIHLRDIESIKNYLPESMRLVQIVILDYEVDGSDFDTRVNIPETITRAFLLVELYKPRST